MYKLPQVVDKYVDLLKVNDDINKNSVTNNALMLFNC